MKILELIQDKLADISKFNDIVFIGYNTACAPRIHGTLNKVPVNKCIETPVAENLMMGLAIGMSLDSMYPIVCFERMDFITVAIDAIVNHLDKLPKLSGDQFKLPMIIRCCIGNKDPLDPGIQHTQNLIHLLQCSNISMYNCKEADDLRVIYSNIDKLDKTSCPILIVEHKEHYNVPISSGGK